MQQQQHRESSRSPSLRERPRPLKSQTLPMAPAVQQIFVAGNGGVLPLSAQQSSATAPGIPTRHLPGLPDQQSHPSAQGSLSDDVGSTSPTLGQYPIPQNSVNTHYPRPLPRQQPNFLTKFTGVESEQHMTEVLADIERVDHHQSQNQFAPAPPSSLQSPYVQNLRSQAPSPPKVPNVERIRAMERASPNQPDPRRQPEQARDSPKSRDRQPNSPGLPVGTPERRMSPGPSIGLEQTSAVYSRDYSARDSPNAPRRGPPPIAPAADASFTPPLQSVSRAPDRSLPFQEADEEFTHALKKHWQGGDQQSLAESQHTASPTPSDHNPEGTQQRYDLSGGRDSQTSRLEDKLRLDPKSDTGGRHSEEDSGGSFTPRSPAVTLPPNEPPRTHEKYYPSHSQRVSPKVPMRARTRNGSTDGLGLRSLTPSAFESPSSTLINSATSHRDDSGYSDHRAINDNQHQRAQGHSPRQQAYQPQQPHYQQSPHQEQRQQYSQNSRGPSQLSQQSNQYHHPSDNHSQDSVQQQHSQGYYASHDDYQNYSEDPASFSYLRTYFGPIPPTPHSQTSAPSPAPFLNAVYGNPMSFSPIAPVGSPYPYPFSHVPRNRMTGPSLSQYSLDSDVNNPAAVQEQLAKQWQIYLQNQVNHNLNDGAFSPAATPFQGANYNPYSFLHTARLTRQARDTMSIRSSPSHEPLPLPTAPKLNRLRKDRFKESGLRKTVTAPREPPPRVESTVPRDTTPEPSSSGEETAGEYSVHNDSAEPTAAPGIGLHPAASGVWTSPKKGEGEEGEEGKGTVHEDDDSEDWVDEDSEDNDMLDIEYHPNYIVNPDKRRRRWEVGWDALAQAFQALDRQTDTTMVVLAAPPHSDKLYSIRSRSIRRAPSLSKSAHIRDAQRNFKRLVTQQKNTRPLRPMTIAEKLIESQSNSGDGSDGSSESRTEDLRRALDTALGSLNMLNGMYELRESRWQEEMKRMQEDKEKMSFVLRQVLGDFTPGPTPTLV